MALAASGGQVALVHVRARVRRRSDVMHAVAARAVGSGQLPGAQSQPVKAILKSRDFIGRKTESLTHSRIGMAAPTSFTGDVGREYRRVWLIARQDPMLAVTVGTYGGVPEAARDRFTVDALTIRGENIGVAPTASLGNFRPRNLRGRIGSGKNGVRTMAIRTNGAPFSRGNGARVNALQVGFHRPDYWDTKFFGHFRICVTDGASLGDVCGMHRRTQLGARDELMDIAVTARASRRLFKTLRARLCVNTFAISLDTRRMASIALYWFQFRLMRHLRNVGVTGRAFEGTMDGSVEVVLINLKRNVFAVAGLLQSRNAVAAQTNILGHRLRRQNREG